MHSVSRWSIEARRERGSKSVLTRLVNIVNEQRNYGTYRINRNYGNKRVFSVNSVNSVCSVVSLFVHNVYQSRVVRFNRIVSRIWRVAVLAAGVAVFAVQIPATRSAAQGRPVPEGPGKEETQRLCSQCHDLDKSFSLRQDQAGWQRTIAKMVAFGMKGTDEEIRAVHEYLVRNFPADDVPKINVNKAEAIDFESGLSLRRSQAAAIVKYREKHGPFKTIEDLKKVPGVDAARIEAKKDRLIFE
jgi:competence protein ComEA